MKGTKFSFKKLFGIPSRSNTRSKPEKKDDSHPNTVERLRDMEQLLQRKQEFLEEKINAQLQEARKHGTKNKRAALNALRRKKRLEIELTKLDGTLTTIEMQRETLEAAKNNVQILGAMKDAANVLKNAQKHISVDKVLDIMDEVNEQHEISKEIADALTNPLGRMDQSLDVDELEKELEELEQEDLNKALLDVGGVDARHESSVDNDDDGHDDTTNLGLSTSLKNKHRGPDKQVPERDMDDRELKDLQELAEWSI